MKEEKYQGKENRGYHCKKEYTEIEKKKLQQLICSLYVKYSSV